MSALSSGFLPSHLDGIDKACDTACYYFGDIRFSSYGVIGWFPMRKACVLVMERERTKLLSVVERNGTLHTFPIKHLKHSLIRPLLRKPSTGTIAFPSQFSLFPANRSGTDSAHRAAGLPRAHSATSGSQEAAVGTSLSSEVAFVAGAIGFMLEIPNIRSGGRKVIVLRCIDEMQAEALRECLVSDVRGDKDLNVASSMPVDPVEART
ncbi:hypothetical protein HDU96_002726 [Phlyctochytrium bullatum]|nr:hypothetical protein HDU96_002726 [Phlyctochytrium bullatum]